ncbi:sensor histidine kinase [Sanyastnella coralliicola]|uniref:sensor histidine kinase n=1 Tax=Sanyastnella coralliicola TaxID=3069118 RepID=UPI0027BAD025|nr:HAMP domain-containing sensor histidine kinase [Longitalea sp. SCSIO 12813]
MSQLKFRLLITAMVLSILSIAGMQAYWLYNAWQVEESGFKKQLDELAQEISHKMDRLRVEQLVSEETRSEIRYMIHEASSDQEMVFVSDSMIWQLPDSQNMEVTVISSGDGDQFRSINYIQDGVQITEVNEYRQVLKDTTYAFIDEEHSSAFSNIVIELIEEEMNSFTPFEMLFDSAATSELIAEELSNAGLELDHGYHITQVEQKDTVLTKDLLADASASTTVPLYTSSLRPLPYELELSVSGHSSLLWSRMTGLLLFSVALLLVLCLTMVFAVRTILRQKRLSRMKSDFVNNMTHEFKTPLATISLATDSIRHPEVIGNQAQLHQLTDIIKAENERLQLQIERVLEAAQSEHDDLQMSFEEVDLKAFIEEIDQQSRFTFSQIEGATYGSAIELEALNLKVDSMHLRNAIMNVIDNAKKYSKGAPQVIFDVKQDQQWVNIEIADDGIGMDKYTKEHAFDAFYRATTGYRHDVKGFGLGLSYAKGVIEKHRGSIHLESLKDQGTTVTIQLPAK